MANIFRRQPSKRLSSQALVPKPGGAVAAIAGGFFEGAGGNPGDVTCAWGVAASWVAAAAVAISATAAWSAPYGEAAAASVSITGTQVWALPGGWSTQGSVDVGTAAAWAAAASWASQASVTVGTTAAWGAPGAWSSQASVAVGAAAAWGVAGAWAAQASWPPAGDGILNPHGPSVGLIEVTIPNGTALSEEVSLAGRTLVGIVMPAVWTAAVMTFQGGVVLGTLANVKDKAGAELTLTVVADTFVVMPVLELLSIRFLKVRSGTATMPVNQGGERVIELVCRRVGGD